MIIDWNVFYIECVRSSLLMYSLEKRERENGHVLYGPSPLTVLFVPLPLLLVPLGLEWRCQIQILAWWGGAEAFCYEQYWPQMAVMTWHRLLLWSMHHPTCGLTCSVLQVSIMWKQHPNIEGTTWVHTSWPAVVWETNEQDPHQAHSSCTHCFHAQQNLLSLTPGSDSAVPIMTYK